MTRLVDDWIKDIRNNIREHEKELIKKTGFDLISLASNASDTCISDIVLASTEIKVGVIPITSGEGIIGSFSNSVAAIIQAINFEVFVTANTDVAGIQEAYQRGAGIIFLADDNKFIAINLKKNTFVDNDFATGAGYVSAMEGAVGGNLKNKEILLIGCGVVGKIILRELRKKGANIVAYDIDKNLLKEIEKDGFRILTNSKGIKKHQYIIDATSTGGWLKKDMLHPDVRIVTPGVPLSFDEEAYEHYKDRVIHDYLPIGVAVMAAVVCK